MASEWEVIKFGDCAQRISDIVQPHQMAERTPYIGLEHIVEGGLQLNGQADASEATSAKTRFRRGDVLFGKLRPYFRKVVRPKFDGICSTDIWAVRAKNGSDQGFLFYRMASQEFIDKSMGASTGTRMPRADWGFLSQWEMPLPPLAEQKAIASILGALDDKIELNRRMNATLEGMARALFQSWFVDFDPVRAKLDGRKPEGMDKATAALFPDAFQESEAGQIPKGWTEDTIKNRASNIQYGFTQSATKDPVGPHFLRITDISQGRIDWDSVPFCQATDEEREKYRIKDGDIFIARTGASTGDNIYAVDPPPAVFASYLIRIQFSSPGLGRLVGEFTRTPGYASYVAGTIGGSAQPHASAQTLAGASIVFPTEEIANVYYRTVRPLDLTRAANDRESRTLATLRDTLLPKLLSGELSVASIPKITE